jgi:hypothetical protein
MNGKILLVSITALFVMVVSSVWGAKTEIPDLKVIEKSKDSYIYSGHVILVETGKPMSNTGLGLMLPIW